MKLKPLLLGSILAFTISIPGILSAQEQLLGINWTVAWDAPTYPLGLDERITYNVYWKDLTSGEVTKLDGPVTDQEYEIFADTKGKYAAGVDANLEILGDNGVWFYANASDIAWSDVPEDTADAPFVLRVVPTPPKPKGLRRK